MNKYELAKELAVSENLHLSTSVKAVDGIIRILMETLASGENVTLRGFGTLLSVDCPARNAVHFISKEPIVVPAHRTVRFRPGQELKDRINDIEHQQ